MHASKTAAAAATLLLLGWGGPAAALQIYCVADGAQLDTALRAADLLDDTADIRLRNGTFATGGSRFSLSMRGGFIRSISGGWSGVNGQCTSQSFDPSLSRLDGGGAGAVLLVQQQPTSTGGAVFISNLTIANGSANNSTAGCVHVNLSVAAPLVQFDRTILRDCRHEGVLGRGGAMRVQVATGGNVVVRNSLFTANQAASAAAIGFISTHPDARLLLNNNTIVGNTAVNAVGAGGVERLQSNPQEGVLEMRNNAVIGNSAGGSPVDLYFFGLGTSHLLVNNAVQSFNGNSAVSSGTVTADASTFRAFGTDHRLRPESPLRNGGVALTVQQAGPQDLDFQPRVLQGAIDIGAYEYEGVFADSFEAP